MSTTKSQRIRHVPLTRDLRETLLGARRGEGLVFPNDDGEPWNPDAAARALHRRCARANVRPIGWHILRHTFASHLAIKGISLRVIQDLLGHSTIAMTERYAHLTSSSLHDAVRVLEPPLEVRGHPVGNAVIAAA